MKKTYARFLWHLKELNKTFSNQPSYYSSKRIERAILFVNAIVIFDYYIWLHRNELTFMEACEAFAINLLYAGFLVKQIKSDVKPEPEKKDEPTV